MTQNAVVEAQNVLILKQTAAIRKLGPVNEWYVLETAKNLGETELDKWK